jgi:NAD(P)-dependent dehydrogenase (short-subunit alcohol dehydrogenase family)
MLASGGAIVNTASVVGLTGRRETPAYVASKHRIIGLTKATALDYGKHGIRVNVVCPGTIRTAMYVRRLGDDPTLDARLAAETPIGRLGTPEDVAEAVVWLCSDASSFVTGHSLVIDGGDIVYPPLHEYHPNFAQNLGGSNWCEGTIFGLSKPQQRDHLR